MRVGFVAAVICLMCAPDLKVGPTALNAQGRISAASSETRRVTQSLDREVQAIVARGVDAWIAYRIAAVSSTRQFCSGSHIVLEPVGEIIVMARLESRQLTRLRVFTRECEVDTGAVPLVWLDGIQVDDSAAWLTSLIQSKAKESDRDWQSRVAEPAMTALTAQTGDAAVRSLVALAKEDPTTARRSRALMALAQRAGEQAVTTIAGAIERDPEIEVKRSAVTALSRLPKDEGIPLLINVARTSKSADVRREAMLRLGQSNDTRAVRFFEEILAK